MDILPTLPFCLFAVQVQQENEPPEELRQSMQEIINQFMTSDPEPARLPPSGDDKPQEPSHEDQV